MSQSPYRLYLVGTSAIIVNADGTLERDSVLPDKQFECVGEFNYVDDAEWYCLNKYRRGAYYVF